MQINDRQIKMVFFDAGGTLFDVAEPVGNTYSILAQQFGKIVAPELLQRNFNNLFKSIPPLAFATNLSESELSKSEYQWWYQFVSQVFAEPDEFKKFEEFFSVAFAHYAQPRAWKLFDDVLPTLEKLKEMRIKTGVISNFDSRLFGLLDSFGLTKYFDSIHLSSRVGFAKPHPGIFQAALLDNKIKASEAIHVGDSQIEDYDAAVKAGLKGWLIDRKNANSRLSSFLEIHSVL